MEIENTGQFDEELKKDCETLESIYRKWTSADFCPKGTFDAMRDLMYAVAALDVLMRYPSSDND